MKTFNTNLGSAYNADCFDVMKQMPDGCVDMMLADLPYGTTACKWDSVIPFEKLWPEFNRIAKPNAAMVFTASQPFTSALVMSNTEKFKYSMIWRKSRVQFFAQAPYRPLGLFEDICVFSSGGVSKNAKTRMKYNPQGLKKLEKVCKGKGHSDHRPSSVKQKDYVQNFTNYPGNILEFSSDPAREHPTQKPVALFEYLIKTYTNEGDLVFDPTAGSLTTGVAAENLNRRWVCCEQLEDYFDKGVRRFAR